MSGVKWHLYFLQLHRHHMGLPWPLKSLKKDVGDADDTTCKPSLSVRKVHVDSGKLQDIPDEKLSDIFIYIKKMHLRTFSTVCDLSCDWKQSVAEPLPLS